MEIYLPTLESKIVALVGTFRFIVFAIMVVGLIAYASSERSQVVSLFVPIVKAIVKHSKGEDLPPELLIPTALYRQADAMKDAARETAMNFSVESCTRRLETVYEGLVAA